MKSRSGPIPAAANFHADLLRGEASEKRLDRVFRRRGFIIEEATKEENWRGVDRWFTGGPLKAKRFSVQYKCDWRARETNNIFWETVSNDRSGSLGWAMKARPEADWLIYFMPDAEKPNTLVFRGKDLPCLARKWRRHYPESKGVDNGGYCTFGIKVPIAEARRAAAKTFHLHPRDPRTLGDLKGVRPKL